MVIKIHILHRFLKIFKRKCSKLANYDAIFGSPSVKGASALIAEHHTGSSKVKKKKYVF